MAVEITTEKREGFRFSNRTINNLSALIEMGLARNKTEAIDFALEHVVTEEKTKKVILEAMEKQGFKAAGETQWEVNKIPQSVEVAFKSPC